MHRHGYKGRKFGREKDQRKALIRGLMCSLVVHQSITTTLAKAKEIRRPMEKLVTLAKKGDLASRRLVIARLNDITVANQLVDAIAPQIKRSSGYLRIERAGLRRGDNAEMGKISFVDDIKVSTKVEKAETKPIKAPAKKEDK
ncbi:MAG: 50S ribosomal protein L17 [Candidatus Nomurabacteria bacterium]|jgi:large subunit ribosomal protein L17|nr:50S ribosomal protein L17 [Candidatus Nomurabacteria bacterium]